MEIIIAENKLPAQTRHYQKVVINILNFTKEFLMSYGEDFPENSRVLVYINEAMKVKFTFENLTERQEKVFKKVLSEYYKL